MNTISNIKGSSPEMYVAAGNGGESPRMGRGEWIKAFISRIWNRIFGSGSHAEHRDVYRVPPSDRLNQRGLVTRIDPLVQTLLKLPLSDR